MLNYEEIINMSKLFISFLALMAIFLSSHVRASDINLTYAWAGKADGNTVQLGKKTGSAGIWEGAFSVTAGDGPFSNAKAGHIECVYSVGFKTLAECAINFTDIESSLFFVLEVVDGKRLTTAQGGTGLLEGITGGCTQMIHGRPSGWLTGKNVCQYSFEG
jgi:hypothetical protein